MPSNKIAVHFKDGNILKGNTSDFFPNKTSFHLTYDGKVETVEIEKLKAIFFVKDMKGNRNYHYKYEDVVPGGGKKAAVDLVDGEKIIGYVLAYSPQRKGFMMTPADLGGNNERIYLVRSAIKNIKFLTEKEILPAKQATHQPIETARTESKPIEPAVSASKGEKRKHARVKTVNLLSYECIDADGNPLDRGMGKTLDISQGGLLMQTNVPIESKYILLMSLDIKEELIKVKGKVAYSKEVSSKIFHTGVRFVETNEKIRTIVVEMVRAFLKTKSEK